MTVPQPLSHLRPITALKVGVRLPWSLKDRVELVAI